MSDTATETIIPIRLVYAGRRLSKEKKLGDQWMEIDSNNKVIRERFYMGFRPLGCSVGTGYTVDSTEEGESVYTNSYREPFEFSNHELVTMWEIKDKAEYHKHTEIKLVKRFAKENAFADAIEPVKRIYRRLPNSERQTFLVMLLKELEREF
jgi:hypothetical protein